MLDAVYNTETFFKSKCRRRENGTEERERTDVFSL